MRKAWRRLARPFEDVIVWLACHGLGHQAVVDRFEEGAVIRCWRCDLPLGRLPYLRELQ